MMLSLLLSLQLVFSVALSEALIMRYEDYAPRVDIGSSRPVVLFFGKDNKSNITVNMTLSGVEKVVNLITLTCDGASCVDIPVNVVNHEVTVTVGEADSVIRAYPPVTVVHTASNGSILSPGTQNFTITIVDRRKLKVGFMDTRYKLLDGSVARLHVANLDPSLSIEATLNFTVTLTEVTLTPKPDGPANMSRTVALEAEAIFDNLNLTISHEATLSLESTEWQNNVEFVRNHVLFEASFAQQEIAKVLSNMNAELNAAKDRLESLEEENKWLKDKVAPQPSPPATTSTAAAATTTAATTTAATTTAATTTTTTTTAATTTTTTATVSTSPSPPLPLSVNGFSNEQEGSSVVWWAFGSFLIVLILAVCAYVLYNNRAKVQLYIFSKTASDDGKAGKKKSHGRKYTPLPTSVHDTLVHED